jgi:hypothetical protein
MMDHLHISEDEYWATIGQNKFPPVQVQLDPEFAKILYENLWSLYVEDVTPRLTDDRE